jgi:hypothetical protein
VLYLVITNIGTNIALLLFLAQILSRTDFFRRVLLNDFSENKPEDSREHRLRSQLIVGAMFSAFCIVSDWIGIQVQGALPNARVIGILSAGFLGGPVAGMLTALVAAIHRYLIFPTRISTAACVSAALLQGILASVIGWVKRDSKSYSSAFLFAITFVAGLLHIGMILLLTRPLRDALEIVLNVIVPMTLMNSIGMLLFFRLFHSIYEEADWKAASMVSLALRTAERCTPYLGQSFTDRQQMQKVIEIILSEYHCLGAAIIQDYEFWARSPEFDRIVLNRDNYPRLLQATKTYKTLRVSRIPKPEDAFYPLYERYLILSAPIIPDPGGDRVLALVLLFRRGSFSYRADAEFAEGLARFFATQLRLAAMERQREELRRAEIKALQTQINPHFLFNALNTISCFCREKPERARELLLALSSYFQNMLHDIEYMVPLETELEHVRAYVMLEEARFEDRLKVVIEAGEHACSCRVPNLILQPIVENAIRHGATKREQGIVRIHVQKEEKQTVIDVSDNGPGLSQTVIDRLYSKEPVREAERSGIGLKNVYLRMNEIFGEKAGLQIISGESGTTVRMIFPNEKKECS